MKPTTATMNAVRMITPKNDCSPVDTFRSVVTIACGNPTTMPAKIKSDIPLPMPRSVICSPIHMMKTVPAVSVKMVIKVKPMPGFATRVRAARKLRPL